MMTADSPKDLRSPVGYQSRATDGPADSGVLGGKYRSPSPRGRRSPSPPGGGRYKSYRSPSRRYNSRSPPPSHRRYDSQPSFRRERRPIHRGNSQERSHSTTLFIGNIPYVFRERDVTELVERHGSLVKTTIPIDRNTGNNRGYAFVEFENRRCAEEAFNALSGGFKLDGRELRIDWDVGRENKSYPERRPERSDHRDRRPYSRSRSPPRRYSRSRSPPRRDFNDYRQSNDYGRSSRDRDNRDSRRYPDYPPPPPLKDRDADYPASSSRDYRRDDHRRY